MKVKEKSSSTKIDNRTSRNKFFRQIYQNTNFIIVIIEEIRINQLRPFYYSFNGKM